MSPMSDDADDKSDVSRPRSVLFACSMNSVRSPMAAALAQAMYGDRMTIDSAGVYEGALDPFAEAVMREEGIDVSGHHSKTFEEIDPSKFDLIIALTRSAADAAAQFAPAERIEFWPAPNPSDTHGGREAVLDAYRATREMLRKRIVARFG